MSQQKKWELSIGAITILLSMAGSLMGTVWYAAQISHQVEANRKAIDDISDRMVELTKIIVKEKR